MFGRDAILNTKFKADWKIIRDRKQKEIARNNQQENRTRKNHDYNVNDKVLYHNLQKSKYGQDQWEGPYHITKVNNNGTVRIQMGSVNDVVNIRKIKPNN